MAAASSFANLIGYGAKKAADDKEDKNCKGEKPTKKDGESDEEFEKRLKDWEDKQDDGESAENPRDTSDDDQDKNDDKAKKALKEATDAARAEGHAVGMSAERSRWSETLASTAAAGKVIAACSLLADTDMSAAQVQKTLAALPAETTRSTLAQRTGGLPTPAPKPEGGEDPTAAEGPKGFAARVTAAVAIARPEKGK